MLLPQPLKVRTRLLLALAFIGWLAFLACSINVKKNGNGEDKKVDINTPVGSIHVDKEASVEDTGLPVYPGAHPKKKEENGEEKNANVNLSAFGFGLKVVAVDYESDDPPAKLVAYYKDKLAKFGSVLECHTTNHVDYSRHGDQHSRQLTCDQNQGNNIELKVGTEDNQHIVAVQPEGTGSSFALVYVRTHGRDTI
ncbi:MAG TPA: hypothetical protein VLV49_06515 [Terriglobales bacterium]|nr:hypothetical protein [Terriglobales bacterium]